MGSEEFWTVTHVPDRVVLVGGYASITAPEVSSKLSRLLCIRCQINDIHLSLLDIPFDHGPDSVVRLIRPRPALIADYSLHSLLLRCGFIFIVLEASACGWPSSRRRDLQPYARFPQLRFFPQWLSDAVSVLSGK